MIVDVVWMIGTKMVHDCEGVARYPVGWVKMVTLLCVVPCFNNMKIVCCWGDALGSSKMDCWFVY